MFVRSHFHGARSLAVRFVRPLAAIAAIVVLATCSSKPTQTVLDLGNPIEVRPSETLDTGVELPPRPEPTPDLPPDEPSPEPAEPGPEPVPDVPDVADIPDVPDLPDLPDVPDLPPDVPDVQPEPQPELPDLAEPEPETVDVPLDVPPEETTPVEQCFEWGPEPSTPPAGTLLSAAQFKMLGKAAADESYTNEKGKKFEKTNQAYVWSLTRDAERVWVGTVANTMCLVLTPFGGAVVGYESENALCDALAEGSNVFADWRVPEIWEYHLTTGKMTQRTETLGTPENPGIAHETLGWRASFTIGDLVFISGPGTGLLWGMPGYGNSFAAYKNGQYLGSHKQTEYNDVRKWVKYGDRVYFGTQLWDGTGVVLRWNGDESALPDSLWQFEDVGHIEGEAAWIVGYHQRLYAITWPTSFVGGGNGFQVWRSPKIPPCGLTAEHQEQWEIVFAYSDYDPDPATNSLAGGGAMEVFHDAIYFGSMHVPFTAVCKNPMDFVGCALEKYLKTAPLSVFKLVEDEGGSAQVEALFGKDKGGSYSPSIGPGGFGNFYNNYFWSVSIHDGWLYVGTMDYSLFTHDALTAYALPGNFGGFVPYQKHGFDVWATPDGEQWVPVTTDGLGNQYNWGARQMLSDGQHLWLGTANPFNLSPEGGWELWATGL